MATRRDLESTRITLTKDPRASRPFKLPTTVNGLATQRPSRTRAARQSSPPTTRRLTDLSDDDSDLLPPTKDRPTKASQAEVYPLASSTRSNARKTADNVMDNGPKGKLLNDDSVLEEDITRDPDSSSGEEKSDHDDANIKPSKPNLKPLRASQQDPVEVRREDERKARLSAKSRTAPNGASSLQSWGAGWASMKPGSNKRRPTATYGSQSQSSQKKKEMKSTPVEAKSPEKVFKRVAALPDIDSPGTPNNSRFNMHDDLSEAPGSAKRKFKTYNTNIGCLDASPPSTFNMPKAIPSPTKAIKIEIPGTKSEDEDVDSLLNFSTLNSFKSPLKKQKLNFHLEIEASQAPVFRLPAQLPGILADDPETLSKMSALNDSSFSFNASLSFLGNISTQDLESATAVQQKTASICPMCHKPVDSDFLESWSNGKPMKTHRQVDFCLAHNKRSAAKEWDEIGYPTIDWDALEDRLTTHHARIKEIIDGSRSHFRDILEDEIRTGKNKTLVQSIKANKSLMPGYYGSRGLRVMQENIMREFASHLRRTAIEDRAVSSRGVGTFVQTVLVPELACLLIEEDMAVGPAEARSIMEKSSALGDVVHEEIREVLVRRADDLDSDEGGDYD